MFNSVTANSLRLSGIAIICCVFVAFLAAVGAETSPSQATADSFLPAHIQRIVPVPRDAEDVGGLQYPRWWGNAPEAPHLRECASPGQCVHCHAENKLMDSSHAVPCTLCHGGDSSAHEKDAAHRSLIPDPGDLTIVEKTCGKCHPDEASRVRRSSMALAPRIINHTRFALGAQNSPAAGFLTVATDGLPQVPSYEQTSNLADDLLRRACLRCHLFTSGSKRAGELRGKGCSACHVPYPNDATNKKGRHFLVRDGGVTVCLKCHNSNHVGADFVGLFEKDYHRGFRSPFVKAKLPPTIYGSEQHRLYADIHFQAGMTCSDCHTLDEIHGKGEVYTGAVPEVGISCAGCHISGDHPAVMKSDGQLRLIKGDRIIPRWDPDAIPHKVGVHRDRLRCSACHAAWSFQDYGFHLMLEERSDYWKWAPTSGQNDPQVQEILRNNVGTFAELLPPASGSIPPLPEDKWSLPVTKDWLDGSIRPGAWFRGFSYRRWSDPPLGKDSKGMISVMRPKHQYVISHVDVNDNLLVDRRVPRMSSGELALIFNPYAPHTIAGRGRACHDCHGNPKAGGLGEGMLGRSANVFVPLLRQENRIPGVSIRWDAMLTFNGETLQRSSVPGAGPLDPATVHRLLNPSERHRAAWRRYLDYTQGHP